MIVVAELLKAGVLNPSSLDAEFANQLDKRDKQQCKSDEDREKDDAGHEYVRGFDVSAKGNSFDAFYDVLTAHY